MVEKKPPSPHGKSEPRTIVIKSNELPKDIDIATAEELKNKWVVFVNIPSTNTMQSVIFDYHEGMLVFVRDMVYSSINGENYAIINSVFYQGKPVEITINLDVSYSFEPLH